MKKWVLVLVILLSGCKEQTDTATTEAANSPATNEATAATVAPPDICTQYKSQVKTVDPEIVTVQEVSSYDEHSEFQYSLFAELPGKLLARCNAKIFYTDGTAKHSIYAISESDEHEIFIKIFDVQAEWVYYNVHKGMEKQREEERQQKLEADKAAATPKVDTESPDVTQEAGDYDPNGRAETTNATPK